VKNFPGKRWFFTKQSFLNTFSLPPEELFPAPDARRHKDVTSHQLTPSDMGPETPGI
jgi:hypothetical protein